MIPLCSVAAVAAAASNPHAFTITTVHMGMEAPRVRCENGHYRRRGSYRVRSVFQSRTCVGVLITDYIQLWAV
uniref:Putative secreted protein n=1 Tax=Anopheles darlingi TaxID=43151 RepID=A0A2M4DCZ2_ANODA